jgi:hypothetical protein
MQINTPFRVVVRLPTVDGVVIQDIRNGVLESQLVGPRRDWDPFGEIPLLEPQLIAGVFVARGPRAFLKAPSVAIVAEPPDLAPLSYFTHQCTPRASSTPWKAAWIASRNSTVAPASASRLGC